MKNYDKTELHQKASNEISNPFNSNSHLPPQSSFLQDLSSTTTMTNPSEQLKTQLYLMQEHISKTQNLVENNRWDLEKKTREIHKLKARATSLSARKKKLKKNNNNKDDETKHQHRKHEEQKKEIESDVKNFDHQEDILKNEEILNSRLNGDLIDENSNESNKSLGVTKNEQLAAKRLEELIAISEEFKDLRLETVAGHLKNESYKQFKISV